MDPGETFEQSLLREISEELGLKSTLTRVAGTAQSEAPEVQVVYLFMEASYLGGQIRLSDEHDAFQWIHVKELPNVELADQFKSFAREYASRK